MQALVRQFRQALESLDRVEAEAVFKTALGQLPPVQAVEQLIVPALAQIGQAWDTGDLALSQVYMSGRFCEALVEKVLPASDPDRKHQPRSAIVVLSDHHMLGQRIVYSVMRASGFELFNYGCMEGPELITRAITDRLDVLMISVLMLPSALKIGPVCARLKAQNPGLRVVVGGAPFMFDSHLWREVGADAMGRTASDAVSIVATWMTHTP